MSKGALSQGHARLTKNDSSRDSLVQEQGGQKIDLIDVEIQPRSDTVKILSHRKTRKIITADLNSIIDESKSETRLKSPGKLNRTGDISSILGKLKGQFFMNAHPVLH